MIFTKLPPMRKKFEPSTMGGGFLVKGLLHSNGIFGTDARILKVIISGISMTSSVEINSFGKLIP